MRFNDLIQKINEGTSPLRRLYHYTELHKAAKILQTNKFELTFSVGADAKLVKSNKRNFYLSTSSIPTGEYGKSGSHYYSEKCHVIFELDASKISDNYKILPIDYWYMPEQKIRIGKNETEERVVSNNPNIPNAKKYIIAVHVYMRPHESYSSDFYGKEREIRENDYVNQIAQSGVDYYIYDDVQSFAGLRTTRAHKIESSTHQYELPEVPRGISSEKKQDQSLIDNINWIINPTPENTKYWHKYPAFKNDFRIDVESAKRELRPATQLALHKLAQFMRKHNKNLNEVINDAQEKAREL